VCVHYSAFSRSNGNTKTTNSAQPVVTVKKSESVVIGYYFCDEPIPYRSMLPGGNVTLGQFKEHISKRGNFRYDSLSINFNVN